MIGAVRPTIESLEQPDEFSAHRARKGELAALKPGVARVEYGLEVGVESFGGVVVVQHAQGSAVACADVAAGAAGTALTSVVAVLAEQSDGGEGGQRIA